MSKIQFFSNYDPLKDYKMIMPDNYAFFAHPINNRNINLGVGTSDNITYSETLLTDGIISINRKNLDNPLVIWKNKATTLHDGLSISINLTQATFFIIILRRNNEIEYDIHVENETLQSYNQIIEYLKSGQVANVNSISLIDKYNIGLNNIINGKAVKEVINLHPKQKQLRKRKRK